jgi:hypothetical protein
VTPDAGHGCDAHHVAPHGRGEEEPGELADQVDAEQVEPARGIGAQQELPPPRAQGLADPEQQRRHPDGREGAARRLEDTRAEPGAVREPAQERRPDDGAKKEP